MEHRCYRGAAGAACRAGPHKVRNFCSSLFEFAWSLPFFAYHIVSFRGCAPAAFAAEALCSQRAQETLSTRASHPLNHLTQVAGAGWAALHGAGGARRRAAVARPRAARVLLGPQVGRSAASTFRRRRGGPARALHRARCRQPSVTLRTPLSRFRFCQEKGTTR